MGITGEASTKTFSEDVLRLEISGPDQDHLSVIDIPGIFKRTTSGVTTKDDMQMVKSMVQGYMENPRSVILAVIPANVDIATQEILEMADEFDKQGERTLGVITKPDLVDKGAENAVMDLVEGRKHQLTLGWHLIRNPGQQESSDPTTNRHALEVTFFNSRAPYNALDKDKVGIPSLKLRLQEILTTHTRREFPKVCKRFFYILGIPLTLLRLKQILTQDSRIASQNSKYWGQAETRHRSSGNALFILPAVSRNLFLFL